MDMPHDSWLFDIFCSQVALSTKHEGNYLSSQQQFVRAATFAPTRESIRTLISPMNQFVI